MLNKELCKLVKQLKKQYDFTNYIDIIRCKYSDKVQKLGLRDFYTMIDYLNSKIQECKKLSGHC